MNCWSITVYYPLVATNWTRKRTAVSQWSEFSLKSHVRIILTSILTNFKRPCLFARRARTFKQAFGWQQWVQSISHRERRLTPDFERNPRCYAIAIHVMSVFPLWSAANSSGFPLSLTPLARFTCLIEGRSFFVQLSEFALRFSRVGIIFVYWGSGATCMGCRYFV